MSEYTVLTICSLACPSNSATAIGQDL
jgi:hypothetical protein